MATLFSTKDEKLVSKLIFPNKLVITTSGVLELCVSIGLKSYKLGNVQKLFLKLDATNETYISK